MGGVRSIFFVYFRFPFLVECKNTDMSLFELYLNLGFKHIVDFNGYDHIVFMLVLCAGYGFSHFRKILVLVVAYIVAHCIALALSTLNVFTISIGLTNFLIPVTI